MMTITSRPKGEAARISDKAVKARTGRTWPQWFRILERAGAARMSHKEIVAWLCDHDPDLEGWWAQMVTVAFEQTLGGRDKHQRPDGYEVSVSRTIAVGLPRLYRAWSDAQARRRWLGEERIEVRKATPQKSMRITWSDGRTSLNVNFYAKGDGRSQVVVQHGKLGSRAAAERQKGYWTRKLLALRESLEA